MALSALLIASSRVMPSPDISVPETVAAHFQCVQCPVPGSIRSRDTALRLPFAVVAFEEMLANGIERGPAPSRQTWK
jgi:hypothetical protein